MDLALTIGQFAFCTVVIVLAGMRLSRYGAVIAEKTGMGGTWTGVVLMAAVTSLPELISGASSVVIFDVPDIAVGGIIGACMFNLLTLAFLDFRHPSPLSAHIHQRHVLTAGFGLLLLGLTAMALLAGERAPAIGWIGLHSLVFLGVYVFAMRTIFVFERAHLAEVAEELTGEIPYADITLRRAVGMFTAAAAVLVSAALLLPGAASELAAQTGLGETFVGSLFVAASTTLPEVAVSVAAARLGALDMAAGNLFGSILFNIGVLGIDDVLYTSGPILATVSAAHVVSIAGAMTMMSIAIIGLTYRASRKRFRLSWDALGIVAIYAMTIALLKAVSG